MHYITESRPADGQDENIVEEWPEELDREHIRQELLRQQKMGIRFSSSDTAHICPNCGKSIVVGPDENVQCPECREKTKRTYYARKLKVRYHDDRLIRLEYIDGKSDWIDLRSAEDVDIRKGEFHNISLGISIAIPEGYEALVIPRSSTFLKYGLIQANSVGLIDESYCGDGDIWRMPVYATRDTHIGFNERICQFRLFKHQPHLFFEETDELGGSDRGGFGSTGSV